MIEDSLARSGMKRRDLVVAVAILMLMALIAARLEQHAGSEVLGGTARAADGDTLTMNGLRIRLSGMDAPELTQPCRRDGAEWQCGAAARARLAELLRQGAIACTLIGTDRYNRTLARCRVGGEDLGARMVREGLAVSYGDYEDAEALARAERKGLWGSSFERPQEWRQQHGRPQEEPHEVVGGILAMVLRAIGLQ
ncbi:thermonuclease family protein [Mycoplana dimorpha]|uniref:Endonuclease YncB(Thermonuclease family) n=2 Tax=Mycoplana dimorpha TaxID=28320 RepID=A0A2T5B886_MYCDI|nr:endonuclease YncB(thermonuclease family) [Mycoplana dimorpha]